MLRQNGVPSMKDLQAILPPLERRKEKPYVVIECFQRIPCDPCYKSCPFDAILPFKDINDLPRVNYEKCIGCGLCISVCPGLAIFVVDETNPDCDIISLPYEFIPLPEVGEKVYGLNRDGENICPAEVIKIQKGKRKTRIITLKVPKGYAHRVRFFRRAV